MPLEQYHWLPKNHLEVLDGHPERANAQNSLVRRYFYPVVWGAMLAGSSVMIAFARRVPILSGIQYSLPAVVGSMVAGEYYGRAKEKYAQEDEARLKYYVKTHPEQFPDYEMVKIGDILEPWYPIR